MPTYKLVVAYDGTGYNGWQQQKNLPSICNTMKVVFTKIFNFPVSLLGVSRTDAGVHAMGQVVRCITPLTLDASKLQYAWNNGLPKDIYIRNAISVTDTFHPQIDLIHKEYHYHLFLNNPLPFFARYGWHYKKNIDLNYLAETLNIFIG